MHLPKEFSGAVMSSYYEPEDLKKFGSIGQQAKPMADDFFRYYGNVTGTDSALSKREKALIALAVSHAMKCPYCIDAYTTQCLETGSNPEQMMEAVHVAAAMQAGITLVHSVQMQNHLKKLVL
jgi:alkylhydroperoxidase/carboxymuconolactone decarboxylase family protein